jgi:uncharacterized protein YbjT (DUF2867 family)
VARPGRILVTGAGGFLGRHILTALRAAFPEAALIGAVRQTVGTGLLRKNLARRGPKGCMKVRYISPAKDRFRRRIHDE